MVTPLIDFQELKHSVSMFFSDVTVGAVTIFSWDLGKFYGIIATVGGIFYVILRVLTMVRDLINKGKDGKIKDKDIKIRDEKMKGWIELNRQLKSGDINHDQMDEFLKITLEPDNQNKKEND